jgi:hypothetical protein
MDMAQRYCERSALLLRLIDPEDLGHLVDPEARIEICRVLKMHQPLVNVIEEPYTHDPPSA